VDRIPNGARLQWWANDVICVADVPVEVLIAIDGGDWVSRATVLRPHDRSLLEEMAAVDPLFTLRFDDGGTMDVVITFREDSDEFSLTEWDTAPS
jgi:hypothetical protein